ncbi:hypothetical protein DPMN_041315 [Dreissena polymorpha]|uniref:Uncharacterized protein n=1 Tax=Dreissena polymorpha TaxID=45954 RepID=A0A9D4CXK4_DREPO|nr:hypothetical protein DPMN_041315 [Dreissena polymorpha]
MEKIRRRSSVNNNDWTAKEACVNTYLPVKDDREGFFEFRELNTGTVRSPNCF